MPKPAFTPHPYYLDATPAHLDDYYGCTVPQRYPRAVEPKSRGLIVRWLNQTASPGLYQWGFNTTWHNDEVQHAYNAMVEKVLVNPFWRLWFSERRCLVPATSWSVGPKAVCALKNSPHFSLGAVHTLMEQGKSKPVPVFAIITCPSYGVYKEFGHQRVPLVIPHSRHDDWLRHEDANWVYETLCINRHQPDLILSVFD